MTSLADANRIRQLLLEHYDAHRRDLPWRQSREPYRVWVSEIMLQQTRVETAIPFYERWMERFPTVESLADSDEESVLKAWEGLGYYSRARNLHRSAVIVRERLGGEIPRDSRSLKALPGIGDYSAGAIASIAHGEVVPAVDGNARRVLSRLFDLEDPTDTALRERAAELVDLERPGDWNQALMELGATVCTPRAPRCGECPLRAECQALAAGTQETRPTPKRRADVPTVSYAVVVALNPAGELLMVRRPPDGLLGGLWEFPAVEIEAAESAHWGATLEVRSPLGERCRARLEGLGARLRTGTVQFDALQEVRHTFTHLKAVYRPLLVAVRFPETEAIGPRPKSKRSGPSSELSPNHAWVSPEETEHLALPVAQRKILDLFRGASANHGTSEDLQSRARRTQYE